MSLMLIAVEFVNRVRDGIAVAVFPVFATNEIGLTAAQYSQFSSALGLAAALIGVALGPLIDRQGAKRFPDVLSRRQCGMSRRGGPIQRTLARQGLHHLPWHFSRASRVNSSS